MGSVMKSCKWKFWRGWGWEVPGWGRGGNLSGQKRNLRGGGKAYVKLLWWWGYGYCLKLHNTIFIPLTIN